MKDIKMQNDKNDQKERLGGNKRKERKRRMKRGERQGDRERVLKR